MPRQEKHGWFGQPALAMWKRSAQRLTAGGQTEGGRVCFKMALNKLWCVIHQPLAAAAETLQIPTMFHCERGRERWREWEREKARERDIKGVSPDYICALLCVLLDSWKSLSQGHGQKGDKGKAAPILGINKPCLGVWIHGSWGRM